jgi:hypothetical protein
MGSFRGEAKLMEKVYLETSFVSYLTARPSGDLLVAAHQQITRIWWENRRLDFSLFISQRVVDEAGGGNPEASQKRLDVLKGIPLLAYNEDAILLAEDLLSRGPFPPKAASDAVHVAVATVHRLDYLLTWNCRHIANAEIKRAANALCAARGYEMPLIITPEELLGEFASDTKSEL